MPRLSYEVRLRVGSVGDNLPTSVVRVLVRPIGRTGAGAAYSAVLLVLRWLRLLRPELLDHGDEGGVRVVVGGRDQAADAGMQ